MTTTGDEALPPLLQLVVRWRIDLLRRHHGITPSSLQGWQALVAAVCILRLRRRSLRLTAARWCRRVATAPHVTDATWAHPEPSI